MKLKMTDTVAQAKRETREISKYYLLNGYIPYLIPLATNNDPNNYSP